MSLTATVSSVSLVRALQTEPVAPPPISAISSYRLPSGVVTVLVPSRMRRRLPHEGFEEAGHVWLLTVRDDLIYRQSVHHEAEEAAAAYRAGGLTLGVGDRA